MVDKSIEKLLLDLKADDRDIVSEAMSNIGKLELQSNRDFVLRGLLAMLHDSNALFRWRAIDALRYLNDKRAVEPLINTLMDDDEEYGRDLIEARFNALVALKDERAIVPLINHTYKLEWKSRTSLLAFGDAIVSPLIDALKNPNHATRWTAAYLLGNIKDPRGINPLIECMKNDEQIQVQAIDSLTWLRATEAILPMMELAKHSNHRVRNAIARAFGELEATIAIPTLDRLMSDKNRDVRITVACSLGKLGNDTSLQVILQVIESKRFDAPKRDALAAVRKLKAKEAIPSIIQLIVKNTYRTSIFIDIAQTLAEIGDSSVIPHLEILQEDPLEYIRKAASEAIAQLQHQNIGKE